MLTAPFGADNESMADVGELKIRLTFDTKALRASQKSAESMAKSAGADIGGKVVSSIGGAFAKITKIAAATATAATAAVGGVIAAGGFDRAMNIEQAQFKLQGLGHDAESVSDIMDNALASVKGTAFGLGDAATVAASTVAAGIKPGQELERTLKLVADASAIAGADMTEMGSIFNKVAANGKLSAEEMNQLSDRGIPILQLLADTTGKTTEEVRDLVSTGKIGFAEFQDAIEKGMGGAALTMGQTFSGVIANVKAALSRLGESVAAPFMSSMTPVLGQVIKLIDDIGSGAVNGVEEQAAAIASGISSAVSGLIHNITPILKNIVPVLLTVVKELAKALPGMIAELLPVIIDATVSLITGIVDMVPELIDTIVTALVNSINPIIDGVVKIVIAVAQALPTILPKIVQGVLQIVTMLTQPQNLQMILQAGLTLLLELVKAIPQVIIALAQALPTIIMNIVDFLTNPDNIMMIIQAGVELFMALVQAVPQIMGALFQAFAELFGRLWDRLKTIFGEFAATFGDTIGNIFKNAINGVIGFIENFLNVPIRAINGLVDLVNNLPGVDLGKIPEFSLPRLAQGGYADGATPAIFGEAGKEAVLPLERNTDNWSGLLARTLAEEMEQQELGAGGGVTIEHMDFNIDNELDARDIGRVMMQSIRRAA